MVKSSWKFKEDRQLWTTIDDNGIVRDLKKEMKCRKCSKLMIVPSYQKSAICYECYSKIKWQNVDRIH